MPNNPPLDLPSFIIKICNSYAEKGYDCVVVGGFVRDKFMNKLSNDIDLATNAPLDVTKAIFKTKSIGEDHGTLLITDFDEPIEITRYRRDILSDGRHSKVVYTDSLLEDLARRDFTFNAIAYNPLSKVFHDPFDGIRDAKNNFIKFVGDVSDRVSEDHLRAIRYYRFIATYGCNYVPEDSSIIESTFNSNVLSMERIISELKKIYNSSPTNELEHSLSELANMNILSPFGCRTSYSLLSDIVALNSFVPIIINNIDDNIPVSNLPIPSHDKKLASLFLRTIDEDVFSICNITKNNKMLLSDVVALRDFYNVSNDTHIIDNAVRNNLPLSPSEIDISGNDLINKGINPVAFSKIFACLLKDINNGKLLNSYDSIMSSKHIESSVPLAATQKPTF